MGIRRVLRTSDWIAPLGDSFERLPTLCLKSQDEMLFKQAYTEALTVVASEIVGSSLSLAIFAIIIASASLLNTQLAGTFCRGSQRNVLSSKNPGGESAVYRARQPRNRQMHTRVSNFACECLVGARAPCIRFFLDGLPFFEPAFEMQSALFVIIELNVQESPNSVQACHHGMRVVIVVYHLSPLVLSFRVPME